MMSNAAFREFGSDPGKQLIHFATSNDIHVERVKFAVEKTNHRTGSISTNFHSPKSSVQYALDITEIVRAQQTQKNYVQTLTKTYATPSIGLAIFDRNRQLILFNPALIELPALPVDYLSARPNLLTAFDKLWDNQIMPETKKLCALEGKACHFGRGSNRGDLHRNLEFTLRRNISDFWASTPRWRIGIFV